VRARTFALAVFLQSLSCSGPDRQRVDEPYAGTPFPDRRPQFTLPDGPVGVVSDSGSDTLTLLDLEAGQVIGSAPVGLDPVELDSPHHVAVDREAGVVFTALSYPPPVLLPGPHAAHGSSQRRGVVQKLALDDFSPLARVEVDVNPGDIVLSADRSQLLVSHFDLTRAMTTTELDDQRADVTIVDAATLEVVRSIPTCVAPHGIAPAAELALVACYGEDALAVVDTSGEAAPELVSIGPGGVPGSPAYGPYAAALSPDAELVAVSNITSNDLRFFEVPSRQFRSDVVTLAGSPYFPAWSPDGTLLFVPTQGVDALVVVSADTAQILDVRSFEADECTRPHAATFAADETTLYLVCEGDHESPSVVLGLNTGSLEIETRFDVGIYPDGLAVAGAP